MLNDRCQGNKESSDNLPDSEEISTGWWKYAETVKGNGDDSILRQLQKLPFFFFLLFPAEIETRLQLNEHKKSSLATQFTGKAAVFVEGTITMASGGGSSLLSTVETCGVS